MLSSWLKYGLDPQAALDVPRLCLEPAAGAQPTGMQQPAARRRSGIVVHLEEGMEEGAAGKLEGWGHQIKQPIKGRERLMIFGRGQMIVVRREEEEAAGARAGKGGGSKKKRVRGGEEQEGRRVLWCGSDGRGDGCAMGW